MSTGARRWTLGVVLAFCAAQASAQPAPAVDGGHAPAADATRYAVKRGDSLERIARTLSTDEAGAAALAETIYRENKAAFIAGDRNRLRRDATLVLPARAATAPPAAASETDEELSFAESIAQTTGQMSAQLSPDAGLAAPVPDNLGASAGATADLGSAVAPGAAAPPSAPSAASPADVASAPRRGRFSAVWLSVLLACILLTLFVWRRKDAPPRRRADPSAGPTGAAGGVAASSAVKAGLPPPNPTGREAAEREIGLLNEARQEAPLDRQEEALLAQLLRSPRDVGALFGLVQIYARRGDRAAVRRHANTLFEETDGEGQLWRRAAELGRALAPDDPLYGDDPYATLADHARQDRRLRGADLPSIAVPAAALELGGAPSQATEPAAARPPADADLLAAADVPAAARAAVARGPADPFAGIDPDLGAPAERASLPRLGQGANQASRRKPRHNPAQKGRKR